MADYEAKAVSCGPFVSSNGPLIIPRLYSQPTEYQTALLEQKVYSVSI